MRQDQYLRLQELTEKLTDAFIREADPDKWPGAGMEVAAMDQQTRGDRYWSKKNAAATLTVMMKTTNLLGMIQLGGAEVGAPDAEKPVEEEASLDRDIAAAEAEAQKMLDKIQSTARKASGKKVHGQ
ncbi:hypothetical protein [Herbaspirillum rubrisubalbicans]|uniref:Uncharacterized protein n=1 Tax=Herbaspirillum rubrisubalbicans TaxID=80842 RepID=A0AAD0XF30_9BURK|nr:hypothetical protein [Herbaspirillum rubrisubalbicans]AYR23032.1 hypothetical protein RC54_04000 [Herbaspirillum rubrisubalbicans]